MDSIEQAYRVLELEPGTETSMREVNQAYKDLVFVWHPDRIPSDRARLCEKAEAKLKILNEARAFLRSQAKNGKLPAVAASKTTDSYSPGYSQGRQSAYSRSAASQTRSYGSYRPGDDSTYRPRGTTTARTSTQTEPPQTSGNDSSGGNGSSNGNGRADGYRPPYEAYRRAAAASSQYGATYRARYPSSTWPRGAGPSDETSNGERSAKEDAARERAAKEKEAREKAVAERKAGDRAAREKAIAERKAREKAAREKVIAERKAREEAAKEKAAKDQAAKDKAASSQRDDLPARAKRDPDLSGVNMSGANLKEKDFSGRNLSGADLSGADLSDTFMHKVNLNRANLRKARLFRANLLQADLSHADLSGADLIGADLSGADLSGADLSGAKVGYGNKIMVKLLGARLTGTIMPNGRIHE